MSGEVYLAEDERGWLVIHESQYGDSSGMEGPFPSTVQAQIAARDMAARFGARFEERKTGKSLALSTGGQN